MADALYLITTLVVCVVPAMWLLGLAQPPWKRFHALRRPDISWPDLVAAAFICLWSEPAAALKKDLEEYWRPGKTIACISASTGLHLFLKAAKMPKGRISQCERTRGF